MGNTATPPDVAPGGIELRTDGDATVVRVRAGAPGWQPVAGAVVAAAWAVASGTMLVRTVAAVRDGTAVGPGPAVFLLGVITGLGVYCVALSVWSMVGHETLRIARSRIAVSNPWLLGFATRRFHMRDVSPFACGDADCASETSEGCCCRWTTVAYKLTFGCGDRRVAVFNHLPRETKDWLRDKLNGRLAAFRGEEIEQGKGPEFELPPGRRPDD